MLPPLPFQQNSRIVLFLGLEFQYLPPPSQTQLLLCSNLNLLFSQPLLPIKLDIRNIHQPGCLGGTVCSLCALTAGYYDSEGPEFVYRMT